VSLLRRSTASQQDQCEEQGPEEERPPNGSNEAQAQLPQRRPRPSGIQVEQARRKLLVQRLEERERHIGFIAAVVLLAFFLALVIPQWHRLVPKNQLGPPELLGVGIGLTLLLLVGTLLRRRATLAFAAFLAGFALLSFGGIILAFPYLFIAGWILIRAWKTEHSMEPLPASTGPSTRAARSSRGSRLADARQRGATAGARAATRSSRSGTTTRARAGSQRKQATPTVTPSKRYTPPKPRKKVPPPKPETLTETVTTKLFARGSSSKQTQE